MKELLFLLGLLKSFLPFFVIPGARHSGCTIPTWPLWEGRGHLTHHCEFATWRQGMMEGVWAPNLGWLPDGASCDFSLFRDHVVCPFFLSFDLPTDRHDFESTKEFFISPCQYIPSSLPIYVCPQWPPIHSLPLLFFGNVTAPATIFRRCDISYFFRQCVFSAMWLLWFSAMWPSPVERGKGFLRRRRRREKTNTKISAVWLT